MEKCVANHKDKRNKVNRRDMIFLSQPHLT
jgi:hypothetical protein